MANKMTEVAKLLGVELAEEVFIVDGRGDQLGTYRLTDCGFEMKDGNGWFKSYAVLEDVLRGAYQIIKMPYRPKRKETYWTYNLNYFDIVESCWSDWAQEFAMLKCGAVFRTKAEAIAARPRIYKELTGKDWEEKA